MDMIGSTLPGMGSGKTPDGIDPTTGQHFRVLIIDDSATIRKIVSQILKSEAYDIAGEAGDGENGVQLYKELKPDVVTLDVNMPYKDGIATLREILDYDKKATVVMLSSESQKNTVVNAITMGAKNYIVKPPVREKVLEKVRNALKLKSI
ncbi:response regulator [Spirochaetota bacterium]